MKFELLGRGSEQGQSGEVGAEVAAVEGGETVGLHTGVGGDEEVGDELLAWPTLAPIAQEYLAGEVSGGGGDGIVSDTEGVEPGACLVNAGKSDGTLRKNDGTKRKAALFGGTIEGGTSPLPASLTPEDAEEHGGIDGCSHGAALVGISTGPRRSSITSIVVRSGQGSFHPLANSPKLGVGWFSWLSWL